MNHFRSFKIICALGLILLGCGDDSALVKKSPPLPCEDSIAIGEWRNEIDHLKIEANCMGTRTYCESSFLLKNVIDYKTIEVVVLKTNANKSCPTEGTHFCEYHVSTSGLSMGCGDGGLLTYEKY